MDLVPMKVAIYVCYVKSTAISPVRHSKARRSAPTGNKNMLLHEPLYMILLLLSDLSARDRGRIVGIIHVHTHI